MIIRDEEDMKKFLFLTLSACGCILAGEFGNSRVEAETVAIETSLVPGQERFVRKIIAESNGSLGAEDRGIIARAVTEHSRRLGLDPLLVTAVIIVESRGEIRAVSDKGAVGLMQVMPYTAADMGFEGDLFDVEDNIRLGAFILADNIRRWGYREGIQRYFWGNGTISNERYIVKIEKALKEINDRGLMDDDAAAVQKTPRVYRLKEEVFG